MQQLPFVCAAGLAALIAPTGVALGQAAPVVVEVSVRHHAALPAQLGSAEVDHILAEATKLLTNSDSASDTACGVTLRRVGNVTTFNENEIPFSISSRQDFARINAADTTIKVVGEINWCGQLGPSIIGCASMPGPRMAVTRFSPRSMEPILWAHEYAHTTGSPHRSEARQIMRPSIASNMREVDAAECGRLLSVFSLDPLQALVANNADNNAPRVDVGPPVSVNDVGAPDATDATPDDSVEAFVNQVFIEGVPFSEAAQFGPEAVPELAAILDNPAMSATWSNAAATLGAIGAPEAETELMRFLMMDPTAELDIPQYLAKANVPINLGWLVHQGGSRTALETLIKATNADWWLNETAIDWKTPIHADRTALVKQLVNKSIIGLTLTGTEEAQIRLDQLAGQLDEGAPQPILAPEEVTVLGRLGPSAESAIIAVSPDTRGAVRAIGGDEFLASQVDELRLIREQGLADYYSR